MYCKPGKVRKLVEKFVAMNTVAVKAGMPRMRVMTDFSAERFWTVVAEMEVSSLDDFQQMMAGGGKYAKAMEEMGPLMEGYHDLVDYGRREIYQLEG